jgi:hypothetical protein
MSEQQHAPKHESLAPQHNPEHQTEHLNKLREKAEIDQAEHTESGKVEALKQSVETQAISGKEMTPAESNGDNAPNTTFVSRELKAMALQRSLNTVRRHENAPERVLSKVMHNKVVERVSEVAGATVARPSGILGGGLFAVLGSGTLLIIVKHYGYQYNYLAFVLLFVGGFALGLILELIMRTVFHKKI